MARVMMETPKARKVIKKAQSLHITLKYMYARKAIERRCMCGECLNCACAESVRGMPSPLY